MRNIVAFLWLFLLEKVLEWFEKAPSKVRDLTTNATNGLTALPKISHDSKKRFCRLWQALLQRRSYYSHSTYNYEGRYAILCNKLGGKST